MSAADPRDPLSDAAAPIDAVRAFAEELTRMIGVARALIESGRNVDLSGFDSQVGLLCAKTLDLAPDEGRRMRPRLIALSGLVEALSRVLAARASPSH